MNSRSGIANSVALAAVASLAIGLAAQREARIKAATEHATLERQLGTLRSIAAENAHLSNFVAQTSVASLPRGDELSELLRLRAEVSALRRQTADLESVVNENREVRALADQSTRTGTNAVNAVPTPDYWPRDSWKFTGYATPDAAFQSSLWAANNGDVKGVLASVTGQLQANIEAELATKSEAEMSVKAMDEVLGIQSIKVLDRAVQPDGTVMITATFEQRYDISTTRKLILQKVGDEWKIAGGM